MFAGRLPSFANTRSMRVAGGLGTIPRVVGDGQEIYRERLSVDDGLARIEALYKPYHRALRRLINKAHQAFGTVILVDCHSMPSVGVSRDEPRRPDMVIGDRYGTSCAALLPDMVEETMTALGYSVGRNKPYAGGFITEHYGNPASGLHTIQIELNRAIYMDERRRERSAQVQPGDRGFRRAGRRAGRGSARRSRPVPGRGGVDFYSHRHSGVRAARTRNLEHFRVLRFDPPHRPGMTRGPKRKKGRLNEQAAQV